MEGLERSVGVRGAGLEERGGEAEGGARGRRIAWGRGEASWAGSGWGEGPGAGHRKGAELSECGRATGMRLPGGL